MSEKTLVSIIIPAYNVEKYIFRGIESCIEQTYSNIEIVIIDDGSTDSTWEIIEHYKKKDARIVAKKQENKGVSSARNHGLDICRGDYVLFLDSDDWLETDAVERLIGCAKINAGYLLCSECYYVYSTGEVAIFHKEQQGKGNERCIIERKNALFEVGEANAFKLRSSCYKLFEKEIIDKYGLRFNTKIYHGEDGLFTFLYLKEVKGIAYVPIPMWNILERSGSATTSPYNSKWMTAIRAIEIMLDNTDGDIELENYLHRYLFERTMCLALECIKANGSKDDINCFRKILKKNYPYFKNKRIGLKRCIQYHLLLYVPNGINILRIISSKKN